MKQKKDDETSSYSQCDNEKQKEIEEQNNLEDQKQDTTNLQTQQEN